jgi:ribosome-binding protein aMBF1 (putative translation factor)
MDDPKKGAEYFQMAMNYRRQLGDSNAEARIQEKIRLYSKAAACWICGREATGQTIHFVSMPSDITPAQSRSKQASPLPSMESNASIYVCRACYVAISKRADSIALNYHNAAMAEMRNMEARLNQRINSVNARIR